MTTTQAAATARRATRDNEAAEWVGAGVRVLAACGRVGRSTVTEPMPSLPVAGSDDASVPERGGRVVTRPG
jgi:hypothetical protein